MTLRAALLMLAMLTVSLPLAWGGSYEDPEVEDPGVDSLGGLPDVRRAWIEADADSFDLVVVTATGTKAPAMRAQYCLDSNDADLCYAAELFWNDHVPALRWSPIVPGNEWQNDFDCETDLQTSAVRGATVYSTMEETFTRVTFDRSEHNVDAVAVTSLSGFCDGVSRDGAGILSGDTLSCLRVVGYTQVTWVGASGDAGGGCLVAEDFVF